MKARGFVKIAAWLEIVAGAILIVVPDIACRLLFGENPEGIGVVLARWVGVGLFALGLACLPSRSREVQHNPVLGLFALNVGIAVLLTCAGVFTTEHGFLLWPAVVVHSFISVALLLRLNAPRQTG